MPIDEVDRMLGSISQLTFIVIRAADEDEVFCSYFGPDKETGKFGLYIGMLDRTPSGSIRIRDLVTSKPQYESPDAAIGMAEKLVLRVREDLTFF
jgi:hypothetical protein